MWHLSTRSAVASLLVVAMSAPTWGQGSGNLLVNPSFESGLSGWTPIASNPIVVTYGSPEVPALSVGNHIGGGFQLLTDGGSNSVVEQLVPLGPITPGTHLRAGGYFGGISVDDSRLVVRFLDGAGAEIKRENLDYVEDQHRNYESVLLLREGLFEIPAGTASVAARVELRDVGCCSSLGSADALFVELTTDPLVPPALPLQTELLTNPGFEAGWAFGSPLTPTDPGGWEGIAAGNVIVKPYSDSDTSVPDTIVSCVIGGGLPATSCIPGGAGNLLADGGGGALRQRLDVRGNAAQLSAPGGLVLRVSAFLGGVGDLDDTARIDARFLDANGTTIAPLPPVGPVTEADRNSETVVTKREEVFFVPPSTETIEIDLVFTDLGCCSATGLADNISVQLELPPAPTPLPQYTNVISNGDFETGSLPNSPLELGNPSGWFGLNADAVEVPAYGQDLNVPTSSFAAANGLGGLLLGDLTGGAALRQNIDLSADEALIQAGRLRVLASAWLGGVGSLDDQAEVRVRFLNLAGVQVGGAAGLQVLGPVTAADRGNQTTLLKQEKDFAIPAGAVTMQVDLLFTDFGCCTAYGLADAVHVVVYDILTGGPTLYPGTGEDLRLSTGVNAPPTSGPGVEVKPATAFDTLHVRVDSPGGTYDFIPLMVVANVYTTGTPPTVPLGFPPGLVVDPFAAVFLLDGVSCLGFGCPTVLPDGAIASFPIPPGLGGQSALLQGIAVPMIGSSLIPANGIFAATEGHEIQIF